MHLRELECELSCLAKAWLCWNKLRLGEGEEMSILSSVNNQYDLKLLQQAALLHDRNTRRPGFTGQWEKAAKTGRAWQVAAESTDGAHHREG